MAEHPVLGGPAGPVPVQRPSQPIGQPQSDSPASIIFRAAQLRQQEEALKTKSRQDMINNMTESLLAFASLSERKRANEVREDQTKLMLDLKAAEAKRLSSGDAGKPQTTVINGKTFEVQRTKMGPKLGKEIKKDKPVGQEAFDRAVGKELAEFSMRGFAGARKDIGQLRGIMKRLEAGEKLSGRGVGLTQGLLGDRGLAILNPKARDAQEQVQEVAQKSLKKILGGQFGEREGERLIERAFNPNLPPEMNAKRLRKLIDQAEIMTQSMIDANKYLDKHGTLKGFKGPFIDFDPTTFDFGDGGEKSREFPTASPGRGDGTRQIGKFKVRRK